MQWKTLAFLMIPVLLMGCAALPADASPTPTPLPTAESTPTPSASPSPTPSMEPSPTASPTPEPSPSPTPEATAMPSASPSPTPTPTPTVEYTMKTYIGSGGLLGILDKDAVDDRLDDYNTTTIDSFGKGRLVTHSEFPAAFSGTVKDLVRSFSYNEEEGYEFYAQTQLDALTQTVKARQPQAAYRARFNPAIPVCTEFVPDDSDCADTYQTERHRVPIYFLGEEWVVTDLDNFPADGSVTTDTKVGLGKESAYGILRPGEELALNDGTRVKLKDISATPTGADQSLTASFEIHANGTLLDTATLQENGDYDNHGVAIRLYKVFAGLGQSSFVEVAVFEDTLSLQHGQSVNTENQNWRVTLEGGGASTGASLKSIVAYRQVAEDLSPGDAIPLLQEPKALKFVYDGLENASFDTLRLTTGQQSFPVNGTDTATTSVSYVRIQSDTASAFDFQNATTDNFYYVVDPVAKGDANPGDIFYQDPNSGFFVPYVHPDATLSGNDVLINYAPYRPGSDTVNLQFNHAGITATGDPDASNGGVIAIPEHTLDGNTGLGAFVLDVGEASAATPRLTVSSGTPTAGYQSTYTSGGVLTLFENIRTGFTSPRGSTVDSVSTTSAQLRYTKDLRHALYRLTNDVGD